MPQDHEVEMKTIATFALAAAAAFGLAGCGQSDDANEAAQADNVEMPAEEAVSGLDEDAAPVADASAAASDASAAAAAASDAADAAEAAVKDAEKKM
jgi:hypothetical protein